MPGETSAREDWILCDGGSDGKGGTVPNLVGRVPLGASSSYTAGSTGGSATHEHTVTGNTGETTLSTTQMASHSHTVTAGYKASGSGYTVDYQDNAVTNTSRMTESDSRGVAHREQLAAARQRIDGGMPVDLEAQLDQRDALVGRGGIAFRGREPKVDALLRHSGIAA